MTTSTCKIVFSDFQVKKVGVRGQIILEIWFFFLGKKWWGGQLYVMLFNIWIKCDYKEQVLQK